MTATARASAGGAPTMWSRARCGCCSSAIRSRPVGARVTLGGGNDRGRGHSRAPARRDRLPRGGLCAGDGGRRGGRMRCRTRNSRRCTRAFERLGEDYRRAALRGRNNGFSNMHQLMTDLHEGRRKSLPCGAGVGLLAVDGEGDLNLCHRFTGSDLPHLRQCRPRASTARAWAISSTRRSTAKGRIARPAGSAISAPGAATTNRIRGSATRTTAPITIAICCAAGWTSACASTPTFSAATRVSLPATSNRGVLSHERTETHQP